MGTGDCLYSGWMDGNVTMRAVAVFGSKMPEAANENRFYLVTPRPKKTPRESGMKILGVIICLMEVITTHLDKVIELRPIGSIS